MKLGNFLWISISTVSVGKNPLDQPLCTEQTLATICTQEFIIFISLFLLYSYYTECIPSFIFLCSATLCFDSNLKNMLSNNIKYCYQITSNTVIKFNKLTKANAGNNQRPWKLCLEKLTAKWPRTHSVLFHCLVKSC